MATEAWVHEKATIGLGDEVANSLAARILLIQAALATLDTSDLAAIKAVTDLLPDAGALTSIAQEATLEDVEAEVEEVERHLHGRHRFWGAVAVPDETNAIESNVDRPFAAASGNNDWGAAIPICGTGDSPAPLASDTYFDAHTILVTDMDDDTTPWKVRFIWGTTNSAAAIAAGDWSEEMVMSNAVPGNRAGGSPITFMMDRVTVGSKMWAQAWNDTNGEVLSFFYGAHGYPE